MKSYQKILMTVTALVTMAGSAMVTIAYRTSLIPHSVASTVSETAQTSSQTSFESQPAQIVQQSGQGRFNIDGADFSQFRLRLLDAVQRADTKFIDALVTPETQWSYGGTLNLESYKIEDNQSKFWVYMKKAITQGCSVDAEANVSTKEPGTNVWNCPDLTQVKASIRPDRPNFGHLAIIGDAVNVREEPGISSKIIGSVSHDYVSFDPARYGQYPDGVKEQMQSDPVNGWTPIRLRTGQQGWIINQYVYDEENDYRVSFIRSQGQWRLRYFLPGNGN